MKTPLFTAATFLIGAMFQPAAAPPIKMGLWETTMVTKMSGMDMPMGMKIPDITTKVRSCYTPDTWSKSVSTMRQSGCTRSNEVMTDKKYTFDQTCKSATSHTEMTFDSTTASHSTVHATVNPASSHPMQSDSTVESHFVGSDCGSVTPDKPQTFH